MNEENKVLVNVQDDTPAESVVVLVEENDAPLDGSDTSNEDVSILTPFDTSKIRVETKNTQMDALIKRMRQDEIDLSPSFQRRGGIWNAQAQSRLIESMLIKIPLPAFYMDATDDDRWLVVDGLQRLTTIRRFVIDEDFALSSLEFLTDYNGKRFKELPRNFQRRIEETDIVLYLIQPGTPPRVKFDIFRRINTSGEPLSSQEIRHALNQGKITGFLKELAESEAFLKATAHGVAPKRMDDRECVLRFLAFSIFKPDDYADDNFDQFLNDRMADLNSKVSSEQMEELRQAFFRAMSLALDIFGNDAFRKRYNEKSSRYPVNKALFESWSVNLSLLGDDEIKRLIARREDLKHLFRKKLAKDKEFEMAVSQGTGSINRVKKRFNTIRELIREVLDA